jgi:excinuclease ABC subunit C
MLDTHGKIIYVGKARNLQKRVSSYFRSLLDNKTQAMMSQVASIQTIITSNENEALLLEANLIKQFHPRYNVLLRDDKSYPYLYLSTHQQFPRLDFYRGSKNAPGRYFGPFPNAGSVRDNLALIQKLFRLRQCNDTFFKNRTRPCLQYQIKRCTAPCVGYVDEPNYRQQVNDAILFLQGKNDEVVEKLVARMEIASQQLEYESAAFYRDQIAQLRRLQKQQFMIGDQGNIDVIGVSQSMGSIGFTILFIRGGRLIGDRAFFPNIPAGTETQTALSAFIAQYYLSPARNDDIPERIVLSESVADRLWIQNALSAELKRKVMIVDTQRAPYISWQRMAKDNAAHALSQHLASKNSVAIKLEALQTALHLPNPLRRIECFDVSHTMGEATVASCVVFTDEGASKKDYRRFNITDITPGDDYAALRQALTRRYTRLKEGGGELPDLLIVDGGVGQLKQAAEVLEELQVSGVILLGVAKGPERKPGLEKLYIWGKKLEIHLKSDDIALHLIQYIRDEAHRFAITAHRAKRAKGRLESPLQQIEGIGPKRRQQLLKHFGGLQELRKASVAEINQVPGISAALAQRIYDVLHR